MQESSAKLRSYYLTAVISLVFAVVGFSYNAWRMEITEDNSNTRTAAFEVLVELAALEQLVYAAHYDQDLVAGNPRSGWVKVGFIVDLSALLPVSVQQDAQPLKTVWSENWAAMIDKEVSAQNIVAAIDRLRARVKQVLAG